MNVTWLRRPGPWGRRAAAGPRQRVTAAPTVPRNPSLIDPPSPILPAQHRKHQAGYRKHPCEFQHFRHIHIQPLATYSGGHHAYGIKLSGGQKLDVIFKPGKAPYQKNGFKYKNQVILTFAARTIEKPSSPRPRPPS